MVALLRDHLAPRLIGRDAAQIEAIWKDLFFATHATAVGAITSLALAAIDTALWDLRCKRAGEPLWKMAGGAQAKVPVYTTEGGWLHHSQQQLVDEARRREGAGFRGCKIKVGKPSIAEDVARLSAVREAVGDAFEVMVDANQAFTVAEARRRAHAYEPLMLGWFEEPLPAEDLGGHVELAASGDACPSRSANRCTTRRTFASTSNAARARWSRSIAPGSAASRRGSRWRIWPRPSTCRCARIS